MAGSLLLRNSSVPNLFAWSSCTVIHSTVGRRLGQGLCSVAANSCIVRNVNKTGPVDTVAMPMFTSFMGLSLLCMPPEKYIHLIRNPIGTAIWHLRPGLRGVV